MNVVKKLRIIADSIWSIAKTLPSSGARDALKRLSTDIHDICSELEKGAT